MQTTVDSLANANSKRSLALMLIEERAAHAQEHRNLVQLEHRAQEAIQRAEQLERTVERLDQACAALSRARELFIRVMELMLDSNEAKQVVIDNLRRDLVGTTAQLHDSQRSSITAPKP